MVVLRLLATCWLLTIVYENHVSPLEQEEELEEATYAKPLRHFLPMEQSEHCFIASSSKISSFHHLAPLLCLCLA